MGYGKNDSKMINLFFNSAIGTDMFDLEDNIRFVTGACSQICQNKSVAMK